MTTKVQRTTGVPDASASIHHPALTSNDDRSLTQSDAYAESEPEPTHRRSGVPVIHIHTLEPQVKELYPSQGFLMRKANSLVGKQNCRAVQFPKWQVTAPVQIIQTCAFCENSLIHQFRTRANLSFSTPNSSTSKQNYESDDPCPIQWLLILAFRPVLPELMSDITVQSSAHKRQNGCSNIPSTLVKPTKPAPVKQTKPPSSKLPKSPKKKPSKITPSRKVRKEKPLLVDEEDEAQQELEPQGEGDDPALELAKKLSLDAHQEKGEGEGADADLKRAIKLSMDPSFLPQRQEMVGGVAIRECVAEEIQRLPDVEGKGKAIVTEEQAAHSLIDLSKKKKSGTEATAPKVDKEQGEGASTTVTSGIGISVRNENQAGSNPGQGHKALAGSNLKPMQEDSDPGKEHVALVGPNPEHMDEDFYATAYPKVHENLKLRTDKHVIEDTDNFGDKFLYDNPTEDDQEKSKVVDESDSTIPDLSHQTFTSTPPVIAPVIDFSSPKPSSQVTPPPINTEATTITTSLPEITPFIALQLRVAKLEQDMSEVKETDNNLIEKLFVLPGPESIKNQESKKSPKEIIRIKREQGFKRPTRKHDSDDDEDDDDDEGPSAGSNQGKSAKRRRHDSCASASAQPPPKDDEQSSKKPHDSNASASKQHPTLTLTGWQITDTRDAIIDSSMHSSESEYGHSEHSSDDVSKQMKGYLRTGGHR
ncbi:hypothetical protein Tco_0170202 [Tanacetum coccineum]